MKFKIVASLILSGILSGCAVNSEPNKTKTKIVTKKTTKKQANKTNYNPVILEDSMKSYKELPKLYNTKNLSDKFWENDKVTLLECEKNKICFKEFIVVENNMILKVEIRGDIYSDIKNKENVISYYNNDVKIFKKNPEKYLVKYGLLHKKHVNAKDMLLNLQEIHVQDLFMGDVLIRYNPF